MSKWKSILNRQRQEQKTKAETKPEKPQRPQENLAASNVTQPSGPPAGKVPDLLAANIAAVKPFALFGHANATEDWWKGVHVK